MTPIDPRFDKSNSDEYASADELLPLVYDELRRLAGRRLAGEKPGQTLQVTSLVNEVYLRLIGGHIDSTRRWKGRDHFLAAASEAMRHVVIDYARRRLATKRGGRFQRVPSDGLEFAGDEDMLPPEDLLALDEALTRFAEVAPSKAELVKLRFFVGLSLEEAAKALGISRSTATRHWDYARSWLFAELNGDGHSTASLNWPGLPPGVTNST